MLGTFGLGVSEAGALVFLAMMLCSVSATDPFAAMAIGLGVAEAAHAVGAAVTVAGRNVSAEERPELVAFDQVVLDIRDEAAVQAAARIGATENATRLAASKPPPR